MRQFAEQDIVLPNSGPHRNKRFKTSFQPWTRLWFDEIDSGRWHTHAATGPSQSGKTLAAFVIPILYYLLELAEPVVVFAPSMDILKDKWAIDLLPTIQRSRFAEFLPKTGAGSQGGFGELIRFGNGAALRFMSGGGSDSSKAAFASRVLVATEIDGADEVRESSREADPVTQVMARLRSHGQRARIFLECTTTIEKGRIWEVYTGGSASRIALPCPHCDRHVTPERADFKGWEHAENELQAETLGQFFCPNCGTGWSPEQRIEANRNAILVHRGQEVTPEGRIVGPAPQTRTLGFRWSAANNTFTTEAQLAGEEWKASREIDRDKAEKARCQQVWAVPFVGDTSIVDINEKLIASRLTGIPRGLMPDDTETLVATVDVHNRWLYWVVLATSPNMVRSVIDYGIFLTPNPDVIGPEAAIRLGLRQLRQELTSRRWLTVAGEFRPIDLHFVDGGYMQDIAVEFVREAKAAWRVSKGDGSFQAKEESKDFIPGDHWYLGRQIACEASGHREWWMIFTDTDHWMRQVHNGFLAETFEDDGITRRPGSIALFGDDPAVHLSPVDRQISRSQFAVQLVAWRWESVTTPKRGEVMQWVSAFSQDHFFDVTYNTLAADSLQRAILEEIEAEKNKPRPAGFKPVTRPDGRGWFE